MPPTAARTTPEKQYMFRFCFAGETVIKTIFSIIISWLFNFFSSFDKWTRILNSYAVTHHYSHPSETALMRGSQDMFLYRNRKNAPKPTSSGVFGHWELTSTRMVVHGQFIEPAVCLSDLYDVFLLDIVRDTKQNLWTMIYRSPWPPNSMRSLIVSDWTSIQSMMRKWIIFLVGGWGWRLGQVKFSFTKNPNSDFFYKESKSNKKNLVDGRGGGGGVARVSNFFFQKNPSPKKKKIVFVLLLEGVKVREDWEYWVTDFFLQRIQI